MANNAFINSNGHVELVIDGSQTAETFQDLYRQTEPLINQIKKSAKPLMGLVDLSHEGAFSLSSNRAALELLENIPYDRLAMFKAPSAEVVKLLILAIGKTDSTKYFDSREEAEAWLSE